MTWLPSPDPSSPNGRLGQTHQKIALSQLSCFCGIDLAKNHFSIHAVDERGKGILHKSATRAKLLTKLAKILVMTISIEACGGAHLGARQFNILGHHTRIMAVK